MKPLKHLKDKDKACFLAEIAERIYGIDPLNTIRGRAEVMARTAISVQLIANGETYEAIGAFFKKDHSSIHYGFKKHPEWMKFDKEYKSMYEKFLLETAKPVNKIEYIISDIKGRIQKFNNQLLELNYTPEMIFDFWEEVTTQARQKHSA